MESDISLTVSLFETRFENDVCSGSLSDAGRLLFGQNGGSVVWKRGNKLAVVRDAHLQTEFVEWFPSGLVALSGGSEGVLKIWDCDEEEEEDELISAAAVLTGGHRKAVLCAAMIGRGRTLASGGRDGLALWEVSDQKLVRRWEENEEVMCAAAVGDLVVAGGKSGKCFVRILLGFFVYRNAFSHPRPGC